MKSESEINNSTVEFSNKKFSASSYVKQLWMQPEMEISNARPFEKNTFLSCIEYEQAGSGFWVIKNKGNDC